MTNKRLLHEIKRLYLEQNQKSLIDNEYLVYFDETNINHVQTIIKAPYDSVYRHKFIRLDFEIPEDYPHSPPKVYFVNYDNVRIHPNMYEDGKCCSTILNTWPSDNERWTSSMGIETVLLTFRSFLDNNPYTFEPGGRDDPTYTDFVLYQSWKTCLFKYIENEQPELFTEYIETYIYYNYSDIMRDLRYLDYLYELGYYETRCFEIDLFFVNYHNIIFQMDIIYNRIKSKVEIENEVEHEADDVEADDVEANDIEVEVVDVDVEANDVAAVDVEAGDVEAEVEIDVEDKVQDEAEVNLNFDCNICFDTLACEVEIVVLECNHTFHELCLISHGKNNGNVCPLCRSEYQLKPKKRELTQIVNPETKRRIKIGGKVYKDLVDRGVLD
jgi:ubiquitin-protein ligase